MFAELPFTTLLDRFGGSDPTPGGGSASALVGSLAASLGRMVGGLTVGKKGYEEVSVEAEALVAQATALQQTLAAAIDEDAQSFAAVMEAMALPKATDDEKAARKEAMQHALKGATLAPLAVAQACEQVARLGLRMLKIGNKNASTDAAVCVLLAVAGGEGALLNVSINLGSLKDATFVAEQQTASEALWLNLAGLRNDLWPAVRAQGVDVPAMAAGARG